MTEPNNAQIRERHDVIEDQLKVWGGYPEPADGLEAHEHRGILLNRVEELENKLEDSEDTAAGLALDAGGLHVKLEQAEAKLAAIRALDKITIGRRNTIQYGPKGDYVDAHDLDAILEKDDG